MKWYIIHYLFLKQVEKSGIFFDFCYNNRKHSSNYRFMPDFCILRIATVTMNLIVAAAIVLLSLYVTIGVSYRILQFVWLTRFPDVATSICAEAGSVVPHW